MANTLTVVISTDMEPVQDVTIASGAGTFGGTVGVVITDPVTGVQTTVSVAWATSDQITAVALAAAINANTAVNGFITAGTPVSGVFTLTYTGEVGATCLLGSAGGGANDAATAALLVTAINTDGTLSPLVVATQGGGSHNVVTVTALNQGTPANSYGLVASGTGVTASGATLANGRYATAKVDFTGGSTGSNNGATINGHLVQVAWDTNATTTAAAFVTALEADPNVGGAYSSSVNASGVVTITLTAAITPAVANAVTIVASGTGVTVSGATFGSGAGTVTGVAASGTLTLSGAAGTVGGTIDSVLKTVATASTSVSVSGNLGIYADGQQILVTAAIDNEYSTPLTVTGVIDESGQPSMVSNAEPALIGQVLPGTTITSITFPARVRTGMVQQIAVALAWGLVCGTTVSDSSTAANIAVAPPPLVGGVFPNYN